MRLTDAFRALFNSSATEVARLTISARALGSASIFPRYTFGTIQDSCVTSKSRSPNGTIRASGCSIPLVQKLTIVTNRTFSRSICRIFAPFAVEGYTHTQVRRHIH